MSTTSFRPDAEAETALRYLESECGLTRSEAIRKGLVELADRRRRQALAEEVQSIANDRADQREKREITRMIDDLAPPETEE